MIVIEDLLKLALEEARDNNQNMIVIWPSWKHWEHFREIFIPKVPSSQRGKTIFPSEWAGIAGIVAGTAIVVSTQQLESSDFFKCTVNLCKEKKYEGPITLLPAGNLARCF